MPRKIVGVNAEAAFCLHNLVAVNGRSQSARTGRTARPTVGLALERPAPQRAMSDIALAHVALGFVAVVPTRNAERVVLIA
jgi:hypothetical protein